MKVVYTISRVWLVWTKPEQTNMAESSLALSSWLLKVPILQKKAKKWHSFKMHVLSYCEFY